MPWDESIWLVDELLPDPSSHLAATLAGWQFPVSAEWIVQAHHLDTFIQANSRRKANPIPKPWDKRNTKGQTDLSPDDARAVLARNAGRAVNDGG